VGGRRSLLNKSNIFRRSRELEKKSQRQVEGWGGKRKKKKSGKKIASEERGSDRI